MLCIPEGCCPPCCLLKVNCTHVHKHTYRHRICSSFGGLDAHAAENTLHKSPASTFQRRCSLRLACNSRRTPSPGPPTMMDAPFVPSCNVCATRGNRCLCCGVRCQGFGHCSRSSMWPIADWNLEMAAQVKKRGCWCCIEITHRALRDGLPTVQCCQFAPQISTFQVKTDSKKKFCRLSRSQRAYVSPAVVSRRPQCLPHGLVTPNGRSGPRWAMKFVEPADRVLHGARTRHRRWLRL